MARLTELKPYIDLGLTAELVVDLDGGDRELSTVYVYKIVTPEDAGGFSGFYYHDRFEPEYQRRSKSYYGNWRSLQAMVGDELVKNPHWKLDPTKKWEAGI